MLCTRTLILLGWGVGPVTPLVLTKYYIIIPTTKPGPESFPAMIKLPRFSWPQR